MNYTGWMYCQQKDIGHAVIPMPGFVVIFVKRTDIELIDLMGFVNTIITHITNGNENEERLVNVMGGRIIETESEKLLRQGIEQGMEQGMQQGMEQGMQQGQAKMIVEIGQEDGLDETTIIRRIQEKIGMSLEEALACMKQYGKQLV